MEKKKVYKDPKNTAWSVDVTHEGCKEIVKKLKNDQREIRKTIKDYRQLVKLTNEACRIRTKLLNELIYSAEERIISLDVKIKTYTPKK